MSDEKPEYFSKKFKTSALIDVIEDLRKENNSVKIEKSTWEDKYNADTNSLKQNISHLKAEVDTWKTKYDVETQRLNETISDLQNQSGSSGGSTIAERGSFRGNNDTGCVGLFGKCIRK